MFFSARVPSIWVQRKDRGYKFLQTSVVFLWWFQNDSVVTAEKEKVDEEVKLFKQEKKTFDEERKKFTEAAIKLGQEVSFVLSLHTVNLLCKFQFLVLVANIISNIYRMLLFNIFSNILKWSYTKYLFYLWYNWNIYVAFS